MAGGPERLFETSSRPDEPFSSLVHRTNKLYITCISVKNKEIVDMSVCDENLYIGVKNINIPISSLNNNIKHEEVFKNTPKCLKRYIGFHILL